MSLDKVKLLIYDLILTEVWKAELYPLLRPHIVASKSPVGYFSVYHESVVMNLLEVMMFHRTAVEEAQDSLV